MNLFFWWVAMFLLGLVAMGLCYLFLKGCEKI
jgi:VIT1/CCC1 family predicted Fe2+/Mn2+ transporter